MGNRLEGKIALITGAAQTKRYPELYKILANKKAKAFED